MSRNDPEPRAVRTNEAAFPTSNGSLPSPNSTRRRTASRRKLQSRNRSQPNTYPLMTSIQVKRAVPRKAQDLLYGGLKGDMNNKQDGLPGLSPLISVHFLMMVLIGMCR